MTVSDTILPLKQRRGVQSLQNCHVFARQEYVDRLASAAGRSSVTLTLHAIDNHEQLYPEALQHARCIVLEVDPRDEFSLSRLEQVRRGRPNIPVIAAIENADFNLTRLLVRQGVFDVVSLPFEAGEVIARVMDASATTTSSVDARIAPMAVVARGTRGAGATTVATHLAAALTRRPDFRCCIVDLDLQFGEVANYLNVRPASSVLDLLDAGERLDAELAINAAVRSEQGPYVLAAPKVIAPLEDVDVDKLLHLLEMLRHEFDFVLIDLPANWTNWTLSAALTSTRIVMLTNQSINGLRQTQRCLELLSSVEVDNSDVEVVVNRFEKRMLQRIDLDDVSRTLKRDVTLTLALEKGLTQAQDQGLLLDQVVRKARFSSDIAALAEYIVPGRSTP